MGLAGAAGLRGGGAAGARGGGGIYVVGRATGGGCREGAGLPEAEELLQAGEDAGEDRRDHGVQGGGRNRGVRVGGGGGGA